ncbi:putative ribonuclease H-like domain-containing protein [Tanacetum coccineum]
MDEFCLQKGIKSEYCVARTPQQNGVAERKNRILIKAARTMLADSLLPIVCWAEAVNTACYVLNWVPVTKPHNKTPYQLIISRAPSISFMRPFGCLVTILNTLDPLGKFDGKAEERFLAGQGPNWLFGIDSLTNSMNYQPVTARNQTNKNAGTQETNGNTGLKKNVDAGQTKEENVSTQQYIVFSLWSSISSNYKSSVDKAEDDTVDDDACKKTVQEPVSEYDQALKNVLDKMMNQEKEATYTSIFGNAYDDHDLETLNTPYANQSVGAEADYNNMEPSTVVNPIPITRVRSTHLKAQIIGDLKSAVQTMGMTKKNSRELVSQGFKQEEGNDYDEVFAPIAWVEAMRFCGSRISRKVYKVEKALYGLHQAPRAWYETLSTYLLDNGFYQGQIDKTLFIKRLKGDILLVQVYVDDIIFGSTKKSLCDEFKQIMHNRFQMSSMGELSFFLGLLVKQKEDGIFISQDKYVDEILKKFGFSSIRTASTPMETNKALTKDKEGEDVDVHLYSVKSRLWWLTRLLKLNTLLLLIAVDKCFGSKIRCKRGRDTKIPQSGGPPIKVIFDVIYFTSFRE